LLQAEGLEYRYREYREDPLSEDELRDVLRKLGVGPKAVLRSRDKAFKELGLTGDEPDDVLLTHMAQHPTLLQRPIGIRGDRAVIGRPVSELLTL
jgi:arsenate reductase